MVRIGVVGLGKMGISHLAILGANRNAEVTALCDENGLVLDVLAGYAGARKFKKYDQMLESGLVDAVLIATPPALHEGMVRAALERGIAVFCEKPFMLGWREAEALSKLADERKLVNQVGYHNRFVGTFAEVKRLLDAQALGRITHSRAEAYGPVVLKPKGGTWRSRATLGGGCLYDYAAHPLNLLTWYFGTPSGVSGSVRRSIFSADADDEVYSTLEFANGQSAHLSVNWSDESQRKMTTSVTIWGENGHLFADRQELRAYLRNPVEGLAEYEKGWNVRDTTQLTPTVDFYLRGEEYSAQLDHFIETVANGSARNRSSFRSAAETDRAIEMIVKDAA
jgi:predicted dehydrogenase